MKQKIFSLTALVLALCFIALCFLLPPAYTRFTDTRMLSAVHTRTSQGEQNGLSKQGRETKLATILYAQAHLLSDTFYGFASSAKTEEEAQPVRSQLQALKDSGLLPAHYDVPKEEWSLSANGLLESWSTQSGSVLFEPLTQKIVTFSWYGDETVDDDKVAERYIAYLGLEGHDWQRMESIAQSVQMTTLYAPKLQLFLSVSTDTRTELDGHYLNLTSLTPQQLAEITK